jgi:hypothetical protein
MIRKITQILFTITVVLLLVSCRDIKQKTQGYVNSYNNSAAYFKSEIIDSTSAKAILKENRIEITIATSIEQNEDNKVSFGQMFPAFLKEMFTKEAESKELIEEGVTFDVSFLASDFTPLAEFKVDKKEMEALMKKEASLPKVAALPAEPGLSPQLQEILVIMNKNMPVTNGDGTKILKIYYGGKNQLVYTIEVPDDLAAILKNDASGVLIKESLLRDGQIKKVAGAVTRYGISNIKYEYQAVKGKVISSIVLTEKDLKQL